MPLAAAAAMPLCRFLYFAILRCQAADLRHGFRHYAAARLSDASHAATPLIFPIFRRRCRFFVFSFRLRFR